MRRLKMLGRVRSSVIICVGDFVWRVLYYLFISPVSSLVKSQIFLQIFEVGNKHIIE